MGMQYTTIVSALWSSDNAQSKMLPRRPQDLILILDLAPLESELIFLSAVVEGKISSTREEVFKAENKVAACEAYGLKIQFCLDQLVRIVITSSHVKLVLSEAITCSRSLPTISP